jgi:hypothetical protein
MFSSLCLLGRLELKKGKILVCILLTKQLSVVRSLGIKGNN